MESAHDVQEIDSFIFRPTPTHACQWLCLSSFPRVETRFNTHYQNAYTRANAFLELLRLSSNSIASTSREEGLVTAQLHCAV